MPLVSSAVSQMRREPRFWPRGNAREVAIFGAVAGSIVAVVLWLIEDEAALDVWVLVDAAVMAVVLLTLGNRSQNPIFYVLVLVTVVIVGESLIGADSGLGFYLGDRLGLSGGSASAQLVRRLVIAAVLVVPVIVLLPRVPHRLRSVRCVTKGRNVIRPFCFRKFFVVIIVFF